MTKNLGPQGALSAKIGMYIEIHFLLIWIQTEFFIPFYNIYEKKFKNIPFKNFLWLRDPLLNCGLHFSLIKTQIELSIPDLLLFVITIGLAQKCLLKQDNSIEIL